MRTPDTPPFTGMKRVFGSTDFEAVSNRITPGATANECGDADQAVTARVVAFRRPTSALGKDKAEDEAEMEEEELGKFSTLDASYPTHI